MGTYTSLRGVVKVKKEYYEFARNIVENGWGNNLDQMKKDYPFIVKHLKTQRGNSIPNDDKLQDPFEEEQAYFKKKFKDGRFYFSADLKNYRDKLTNVKPIESFIQHILENISEDILLLETNCEDHSDVLQYDFSDEVINQIGIQNYTNEGNEMINFFEENSSTRKENDIFKEYKEKNGLYVFTN